MKEKSKLNNKIDFSNVPAFTEKAIKTKMNKKSKIGNKINKFDKENDLNYYQRDKLVEKAKKKGYFSLYSFVNVYKRQILVSYPYYFKYFNLYPSILSSLIQKGIIEVYENDNKNNLEVDNTLKSYRIPFDKADELVQFTRKYLLSEYQRNVFIKKIK